MSSAISSLTTLRWRTYSRKKNQIIRPPFQATTTRRQLTRNRRPSTWRSTCSCCSACSAPAWSPWASPALRAAVSSPDTASTRRRCDRSPSFPAPLRRPFGRWCVWTKTHSLVSCLIVCVAVCVCVHVSSRRIATVCGFATLATSAMSAASGRGRRHRLQRHRHPAVNAFLLPLRVCWECVAVRLLQNVMRCGLRGRWFMAYLLNICADGKIAYGFS